MLIPDKSDVKPPPGVGLQTRVVTNSFSRDLAPHLHTTFGCEYVKPNVREADLQKPEGGGLLVLLCNARALMCFADGGTAKYTLAPEEMSDGGVRSNENSESGGGFPSGVRFVVDKQAMYTSKFLCLSSTLRMHPKRVYDTLFF